MKPLWYRLTHCRDCGAQRHWTNSRLCANCNWLRFLLTDTTYCAPYWPHYIGTRITIIQVER